MSLSESQLLTTSVIICTHNPHAYYLRRVLDALSAQTLPKAEWELLLVDNVSTELLAERYDLSWHPRGRHVREGELGLTPARLRGIAEAKGALLVFVDDDNVLSPSYLQQALQIFHEWPILGAWGGSIIGEFEVTPESWTQSLLPFLGIREVSKPIWSNNPDDWRPQPCGAGMCIRTEVAKTYLNQIDLEPRRRQLDRVGQTLSSCGDSDLILTSCDLGLGFGNFPQLLLTHLIPARRLEPAYLISLMQGIVVSEVLLQYLRRREMPNEPSRLRTYAKYLLIYLRQGNHPARIYKANRDALRMGIRAAQAVSTRP